MRIHDEYLKKGARFPITLDPNVQNAIDAKFMNLKTHLTIYLFIELYAFVLDKLRSHFERFQNS